jgi:hypothetical protein
VAEGKSSRTHTNIFEIIVGKNRYVFSVDSLTERAEWISMIKDITLPKQMRTLQRNEYENGGLHGLKIFFQWMIPAIDKILI